MVRKKGELLDVQQLQVVAQLINNMEIVIEKLNDAYSNNDAEKFKQSKIEILTSQKQIEEMLI